MKRINDYVLRPGIFLACALLLGIAVNAQTKELNGYYQSDDGGAYYIRQIGDKVFWFGEDPDGTYANVLSGSITGNKISARWWDVPKGKTKGLGDITLEVRDGGATLVKLSSTSPFGSTTFKKLIPHNELVNGLPMLKGLPPEVRSRPAGFSGGENNMTGAWVGDDYAFYYVRELPTGDVVWVAEHPFYGGMGGTAKPAFTHIFFGKKTGASVSGQWVDVPKGKASASGMLTLSVKDAQSLLTTAKTGGFLAGELWRSLPGSLRGYADLHAHPMSNLGFGTKLVHGGPDVGSLLPADIDCHHNVRARNVGQALGSDPPSHGVVGPDNPCGDASRAIVVRELEGVNESLESPAIALGYPSFRDWPKWNDITHQKMWVDWIRRSYDGGQRVMVALAVNNYTIASAMAGLGDGPTDDKASADRQIAEIKAFVKRHDDFMEVAFSPADLRRIVASNKLAVVLGIEIDDIGNLSGVFKKTPIPDAAVAIEIDRLISQGVRYIFPIHLIDNKFGGTAVYQDIFNLSNYHVNGKFFTLKCSTPGEEITHKYSQGGLLPRLAGMIKGFNIDILRNPPDNPVCAEKGTGHKNALGLTSDGAGERAIKEMMRHGMLIDIDHMSQAAANKTLDIAENVFNGYPVVSGHNNLRSMWPIDKAGSDEPLRQIVAPTENARTEEQLKRLGRLGGMFGLGSDGVNADDYLKRYVAASELVGRGRVSFGSDLNGLVKGPPPYNGVNIYSQSFPMSKTGDRAWDYRKDGVAHYGMMADFLRDMSLKRNGAYIKGNIMKNAEYFAEMWEKAVNSSKRVEE